MKRKGIKLLAILLLYSFSASAQTKGWKYQAKLEPVPASGFYNLVINPAINAHLKTDFSDLRIVNDSGNWVPHLLRKPNTALVFDQSIWELSFQKKENENGNTEYIIQSPGKAISNLQLQLKNTAAERFAELTGSDDEKKWYSIADSVLIQPMQAADKTIASFVWQFPAVNYQFFKITIHNNTKAPFNVTGIGYAGIAEGADIPLRHPSIENPVGTILQKDSNKHSYIRLVQPARYHVNEVQLTISGPPFFNRQMELYMPGQSPHSFQHPGQRIAGFTISNNSTLRYRLPVTIKTDTFYLVIKNEDNLPLTITSVKTFAEYAVATVYLEKTNGYSLLMDNVAATPPNYDMDKTQINFKEAIPAIGTKNIELLEQTEALKTSNNKWILWMVILLAGVVLAWFAWKLLSEMNKPNV